MSWREEALAGMSGRERRKVGGMGGEEGGREGAMVGGYIKEGRREREVGELGREREREWEEALVGMSAGEGRCLS